MKGKRELTIAEIIRDQRKALGLSGPQLAKMIGLGRSSISQYELGTSFPTLQVFLDLASVFKWKESAAGKVWRCEKLSRVCGEVERSYQKVMGGRTKGNL